VAELWWSSWVPAVAPYAVLLRLFADGSISADEFEVVFLRLYKADSTDWSPDLFKVLDELFADVDDYCADPKLRQNVGGLDQEALRAKCKLALAELEDLAG
jgi:Bacterial self-protective colicin-like immunity